MVAELTFQTHYSPEQCNLDIVFVHGLTGDPMETWSTGADQSDFWPLWISESIKGVGIHTVGYPASLFEKLAKKEMDIYERAENAIEYMLAKGIGTERPVAFIAHSLGGLLTKQILRTAHGSENEDWKEFFKKTAMVVFLATPHTGSSLGSVLKFVLPRIASKHIETLTNDNGFLVDLNKAYRDFAPSNDIITLSYYEKYKTKDLALVVNQQSADPGVHKCRAIAVDADHVSICKPKNKDSLIYCTLLRHINKLLEKLKANDDNGKKLEILGPDDYAEPSGNDRRDLLTKLIDAGREHEYDYANDCQNKFAQRYVRLGLHSEEKVRSDTFLSDIEQRFVTHIYHSLICRSASDIEISEALQKHVIDPICVQYSEKIDNLTAKTVLRALYFLTEQCHIRWDAA